MKAKEVLLGCNVYLSFSSFRCTTTAYENHNGEKIWTWVQINMIFDLFFFTSVHSELWMYSNEMQPHVENDQQDDLSFPSVVVLLALVDNQRASHCGEQLEETLQMEADRKKMENIVIIRKGWKKWSNQI